jgi:hypothetical protein
MSVKKKALNYVIIRTTHAGVFAGYLKFRVGTEAELTNVRRIWYWEGAASLSQLAVEGTSKPGGCKFPVEVPSILLTGVIEVLSVTTKAKESIAGVPVWRV